MSVIDITIHLSEILKIDAGWHKTVLKPQNWMAVYLIETFVNFVVTTYIMQDKSPIELHGSYSYFYVSLLPGWFDKIKSFFTHLFRLHYWLLIQMVTYSFVFSFKCGLSMLYSIKETLYLFLFRCTSV